MAASAGLFHVLFCRFGGAEEASQKPLLLLLGLLPNLYALYIVGVLGLYTILEGVISEQSVWSMISGVLWVFVGFQSDCTGFIW